MATPMMVWPKKFTEHQPQQNTTAVLEGMECEGLARTWAAGVSHSLLLVLAYLSEAQRGTAARAEQRWAHLTTGIHLCWLINPPANGRNDGAQRTTKWAEGRAAAGRAAAGQAVQPRSLMRNSEWKARVPAGWSDLLAASSGNVVALLEQHWQVFQSKYKLSADSFPRVITSCRLDSAGLAGRGALRCSGQVKLPRRLA